MSWYRAGSVTVANGSNVVTGAGTDFVANVAVGDAFIGQDGRSYEVAQVVSATELRLVTAYPSAGYAIQPTQNYIHDLALSAGTLLATFAAVRDGVGQGLFGDGVPATPAIRFAADQDTGIRRYGDNMLAVVAGGVDQVFVGTGGVGINHSAPKSPLDVLGQVTIRGAGSNTGARDLAGIGYGTATYTSVPIILFRVEGGTNLDDNVCTIFRKQANGVASEAMRIDASGNWLVGVTSGSSHIISRGGAASGAAIIAFQQAGAVQPVAVYAIDFNGVEGANSANAALKAGRSSTGRSIATSGTINASGADYAEYMVKAAGCGLIAKGDVCGVDRDGHLTQRWADAISCVVKSTEPGYTAGDNWAKTPRPKQAEDESEDDFNTRVAAWKVIHDAERAVVDRIAFSGQVPCNVTGDFAVGDYIIATQDGGGIKAVAVKAEAITLAQYMTRIGKVWAIRDNRAWIDVQHG